MDRYQYLLLMGACVAVTLPLEFAFRARVYRRPALLVTAVVPVVLAFSAWDLVGIWRGHWSYNPDYVTGIRLPGGLPLEELVFFVVIPICGLLTYEAVVIPICGLLTYEAVGWVLGRLRRPVTSHAAAPPVDGQDDA